MIAISTYWKSTTAENGDQLLSSIIDAGFEAIELDSHLTQKLIDEMRPKLSKEIQVVSVQNYCPIPDILPKSMAGTDAFLLSSPDKEYRQMALKYAIKTIELADSVEARATVFHFGHVEMIDPTDELLELYNKGEKESNDFESMLRKAKDLRESKREKNFDAVLFSLEKLIQRAESLNVSIGIENRREIRQIPDIDEIDIILSEFSGAKIAYWHNTEHAQIHEKLGVANYEDFLKKNSDKVLGVHIHKIKDDNILPKLKEYLPQDAIKVMQLNPQTTDEEVGELTSRLKNSLI